jgi:hypothetical protein
VLLPTPPFCEIMPMIRDISLSFLLFFSEYHEEGISEKQKSRKTEFALALRPLASSSARQNYTFNNNKAD